MIRTDILKTSGTSNLADQPITGKHREDRIFSDKENIYAYEKQRDKEQAYPQVCRRALHLTSLPLSCFQMLKRSTDFLQRTAELAVIETGIAHNVKTYVIMSGLIYGTGTGLFNRHSIQIPIQMRAAIKAKEVTVIGEGKGTWDYVHIEDLGSLYELFVAKFVA